MDRYCLQMSVKLEPSSVDMLECVAVEIPQAIRKGLQQALLFVILSHIQHVPKSGYMKRLIIILQFCSDYYNILLGLLPNAHLDTQKEFKLRKNEETHLDAFEMKGLRKILRVSRTTKKTNEWVLNKAGVKRELLDTLEQGGLNKINTCRTIELQLGSHVHHNLVKYCSNTKRNLKVINSWFMWSLFGDTVYM